MRITELQRREDFQAILCQTLATGWSCQFGTEVRVVPSTARDAWRMQPLLNACFEPGVSGNARSFMRDNFRYTPVRRRAVLQWLAGTILASQPGLALSSQPVFEVRPALPQGADLLVVPGNHRIRVFDFAAGTARAWLKAGFPADGLLRDIRVRGSRTNGPFPPLTRWDAQQGWLEEAIVQGQPLPRCRPGVDRGQCVQQALLRLDNWLAPSVRRIPVGERLACLQQASERHLAALADCCRGNDSDVLQDVLAPLSAQAAALDAIEVAETHGDFQPGNIMVADDGAVLLTDWEHSGERFRYYDALVFHLRTRAPAGLGQRLQEFLAGATVPGLPAAMTDPLPMRRACLALFLLEDIEWVLAESLAGPYRGPPTDLDAYLNAIRRYLARTD